MDRITVTEVSTGQTVLDSNFLRLSVNDGMLAIMLEGKLNNNARNLLSSKLYKVKAIQENELIMDSFCNFISYNFIYMNVASDPNMAVGDNTVLFKIFS